MVGELEKILFVGVNLVRLWLGLVGLACCCGAEQGILVSIMKGGLDYSWKSGGESCLVGNY